MTGKIVGSALLATLLMSGCTDAAQKADNKKIVDDNKTKSSVVYDSELAVGKSYPMEKFNVKLGTATFRNGHVLDATYGLGSGAFHYKGDAADTVYIITDRGVNIKCKDDEEIVGMDICEKGKIFPFSEFTPLIIKAQFTADTITVKEIIELKDRDGKKISGISNPLSNFSEIAYDMDGKEMAYDPNGLDVEAVMRLSDGSFWLSEEYAPSLVHVAADGKIIKRLVPAGLEGDLSGATYDVEGSLPAILAKRHANRGIESIAISPDEQTLYFAMQSPLDNPDYGKTRNLRLYAMNIDNPVDIKEYLYRIDLPDSFDRDNEKKTRKQKDVKVSEIVALSDGSLLISERVSRGNKLYKVDLSTEIPVPTQDSDTLETNDTLTPVAKHKVFDTDFVEGVPSKIEGIADLGNGDFFLINDNDFGIEGDDVVAKVMSIDVNGSVDKKQTHGRVVLFDTNGTYIDEAKVGILPDMVKFTHDGKRILVANEGELMGNEDLDAPLYDPYGSVSVIDTNTMDVETVDFKAITTAPAGSKIRKGAEIARDFEPEYIAINEDDTTAWVSLQESNAMARIDLSTLAVSVTGYGFKDLSLNENALDYKKDGVINIETTPSDVYGMYQPDTIQTYRVGGKDYVVTANEGDDRDDFYAETTKASKLTHTAIGDIGDLRVNPDIGDADGDGDYEALYSYGARSFSIFDGESGALVYDSANALATTVANDPRTAAYFNTRPKKGKWYDLDERSEKKGIEPEALTLAHIDGKVYAYVGLEKQGGFFVYDITDPVAPVQVEYFNDINYSASFDYKNDPVPADIDDMAPEGSVTFVQNGKNYMANANEVSGTVSLFALADGGRATKLSTYRTGIYYKSAAEIVDYDSVSQRLFVTSAATNSVMILDISDETNITKVKDIDLAAYGTGVNSVSVSHGKIAVAVERSE